MHYQVDLAGVRYRFASLREVMAKASPPRSGDQLAGVAATSEQERMAARWVLSEVPLRQFLEEPLIPYESDEVTRLIIDTHDESAFEPVSTQTVDRKSTRLNSSHIQKSRMPSSA